MTQEISINRAKIFCKISNDINKEVTPDLVLIPASSDTHQAHRVIHEEAKRIFKNTSLWSYELPWNTYAFIPHVFVSLVEKNIRCKKEAISYFPSHGKDSFMENGIIDDLARLRGKQINKTYAEGFELIRQIID